MVPSALALPLAIVAALAGVVGAAGAARAWRRRDRDDALWSAACAVMGLAMAGMLEPGVAVVPSYVGAPLFAAAALWSVLRWAPWRARATRAPAAHGAVHATMCGAMVFMYALGTGAASPGAPASATGMAMSGGAAVSIGRPVATLALAIALAVVAAWRLTSEFAGVDVAPRRSGPGAMARLPGHRRADAVAAAAMGLVMAYALVASL